MYTSNCLRRSAYLTTEVQGPSREKSTYVDGDGLLTPLNDHQPLSACFWGRVDPRSLVDLPSDLLRLVKMHAKDLLR